MAMQVAQAYRGHVQGQNLPISALIIDSAPGLPTYADTVRVGSLGVPNTFLGRWLGMPITYVAAGMVGILNELGFVESAHHKLWRVLNEMDGPFLRKNLPRAYMYSDTDSYFQPSMIEGHADIARREIAEDGMSPADASALIKTEKFIGSSHVNHVSVDPERYWQIVEETWKKSIGCIC